MKVKKGDYGYIKDQKIRRLIRVLLLLILPAAFLIIGLVLNQGDRRNIYTIIAIVGCIPLCMAIVSMIMMWMRKPMEPDLYREVKEHAGSLEMVYELYLTTYEKSVFLDAAAVCGEYVIAYSHEKLTHGDISLMESHIVKTMRANGYKVTAKIFTQKKQFLDRLDSLREKQADYEAAANANFKPYEKYPDLTRNEVIRHLLMAVSL